jgi:hypothetical protein
MIFSIHELTTMSQLQSTTDNLLNEGKLEEVQSPINTQTIQAKEYIEGLLAQRAELVYRFGALIAETILKLEQRLWDLWVDGSPLTVLESINWKDELDKPLLSKIIVMKKAKKECLSQQEICVIIGNMLENYFNRIYDRILHNEVIEELQPLQKLVDYSSFTLLYIWAHQAANVHLAINRLDLKVKDSNNYKKTIGAQLNILLNNRMKSIEQEIRTVQNNWTVSTLSGEKPFKFAVTIERA